jgi:hypothetical protein
MQTGSYAPIAPLDLALEKEKEKEKEIGCASRQESN